jgi:hypothetical protein
MSAESLAVKYIVAMEKTIKDIKQKKDPIVVSEDCVNEILGYVTSYLEDARYFRDQEKFETSLTSIAYCEGLLDALKLIGAVKIQEKLP